MALPTKPLFKIEPWTKNHDASEFTSSFLSIKKYIQEQAARDISSFSSAVFVLVENGSNKIRGYYSLSSISIIFEEMPQTVQKKLPRYPQISGILLGRIGVDSQFSEHQKKLVGEKPRFGEMMLVDAQIKSLASVKDVGSALMVVDALMPNEVEMKAGAIDPLPFYTQYGFIRLNTNSRRLIKTMRIIAKEFDSAK